MRAAALAICRSSFNKCKKCGAEDHIKWDQILLNIMLLRGGAGRDFCV
jgi:hypothetical protein